MDAAASGAHTKAAIGMEAQRGINAIFLPVPDVVNHDDVNELQAPTTPTRQQHQDAKWDKLMERLDLSCSCDGHRLHAASIAGKNGSQRTRCEAGLA